MKRFFITGLFLLNALVFISAQGENIIKETATPNPHYYAVIISGGIDDSYNYLRYWNDMSSIFCALTQVYGYMPENIFVHSTDGTITHNHGSLNLDNDQFNIPDIDFPASKSNITNTFQTLASTISADDQLFVFVTNHGGRNANISYMNLWGTETITTTELKQMLVPINTSEIIVLMEPSYSGGFISDVNNLTGSHRVVQSSCTATENSFPELWITNGNYSEFVYYWTAAVRGYYPGERGWQINEPVGNFPFSNYFPNHPADYNPDTNGDSFVQMQEAFSYANNFNTWSASGFYYPYYSGTSQTPTPYHNIGLQEDLLNLGGISGSIANTQTIEGSFLMSGNLSVQSSRTLTINPQSKFHFLNGSSLIVNGNLAANGTPTNKVTFDFIERHQQNSNGIKAILGSSITITNSIIKNGYRGVDISLGGGDYLIQNSSISDCKFGVAAYYGESMSPLTIQGCEFINNLSYGILVSKPDVPSPTSQILITNNTIESSLNGIYLFRDVGTVIQESYISNCGFGIYLFNAQPSIVRNYIHSVITGIYCYAPGKSPLILGNHITYEQILWGSSGIWVEGNTTAYIANNDISGRFVGIYCTGGVNSYFSDYEFHDYYPNNRISNNLAGIIATSGSYIYAGKGIGDGCWNNSIYRNENYDVSVTEKSYVMAQYNYWGGGRPNAFVDETSELYADEILEEDPWSENKLHSNLSNNFLPTEGTISDVIKGIQLEKEGKINDAVKHYKQMIGKNSHTGFALNELAKYRNRYSISNVQGYFSSLMTGNNNHKDKVLRHIASIFLDENRYNEALQTYDKIISQYPERRTAVYARFDKFYAAIHYANDLAAAGNLLQEIKSLALTDDEFLIMVNLAEIIYNNEAGLTTLSKMGNQSSRVQKQQTTPNMYSLLGNYPNPFNPSTTISYALPFESEVTVTIYDLTGSVIRTFDLSNQSAGYKDLLWDGRNDYGEAVTSGVYIYTLKAISLEGNGKTFVKSSKCMLLK